MSIDINKHTYRTFGSYPNILMEYPGLNSAPANHDDLTFKRELRDIATTIARKHPAWNIVLESGTSSSSGPHKVVALRIYHDGEKLGRVYCYSRKYSIAGKAISKILIKRTQMETENPKKVIQTINKLFAPTGAEERIAEAIARTAQDIHDAQWNTWVKTSSFYQMLTPVLFTLLAKNPEGMRELLLSVADEVPGLVSRKSLDAFDKLASSAEKYRASVILHSVQEDKAAQVYVVYGDRYLRGSMKQPDTTRGVVTLSELPDDTRTKLALLKMSGSGKLIDHVGYSVSENIFYVFD